MAKIKRTFIFNSIQDADLLAALDSLPDGEKSSAVRQGLRLFFDQNREEEPALSEELLYRLEKIQAAIDALRRDGVQVAASTTDDDEDLDSEVRNTLLNMGL